MPKLRIPPEIVAAVNGDEDAICNAFVVNKRVDLTQVGSTIYIGKIR